MRDRSVSRKYVDRLQQRIETLEALNKRTSAGTAGRSDEDSSTQPADAVVVACGASASGSGNRTHTLPLPGKSTTIVTSPRSPQPNPTPPIVDNDPPVNADDQSPSFYGATCHPHVLSPGKEASSTSFDDSDVIGIDLDPTSPHLRDQLIQTFFKYQTLWVEVVNKDQFLAHQAHERTSRWFSKFLENAILACGTRLSTSKAVRALGSKYQELARDDVLAAISKPTPANLQGFLVLSEYEVTQGNDRAGWMFCGVACRMLSDIGLHELSTNVDPSDEAWESTKEKDIAYNLLSACVVYEGVWSLYLGRPSSIPVTVMSTVTSRHTAGRGSDSPWIDAWVGLCGPMAEISHLLNEQSISSADRSISLRTLLRQVEDWYDRLPPGLAYDEHRLTNMSLTGYGLHTQYCKVQIHLRHALSTSQPMKKRQYSQITGGKSSQTSSNDPNTIIYQYALRIARLVVTYRETCGVEKIPSIMLDNAVVAASEMIGHLRRGRCTKDKQNDTIWFQQLMKSLEMVQPHFPVIGRMLDVLKRSGWVDKSNAPVIRHSTNAPAQELQPLDNSRDLDSALDNLQNGLDGMGSVSDMLWDSFGTEAAPAAFLSDGFDDFVLGHSFSEALTSSFAQASTGSEKISF
ncbi:putative Fungal-specific transcription factor domain-containing protein [Seiridium cardinale]|uniref:Fungal-specific transcription factor domain-containing protein n=1 Tax=Seiridium cardinale TaxID=138064 RepID=A0ABR2XTL1_9PEZI